MSNETININGVEYILADQVTQRPSRNRAVVVIDRGWIFAGDVSESDGRIILDRVVWVFRWESIGFDAVIANPKSEKVTLRVIEQSVDLPTDAEIFRIPVADDWGL